jgi:hypothetical protein
MNKFYQLASICMQFYTHVVLRYLLRYPCLVCGAKVGAGKPKALGNENIRVK